MAIDTCQVIETLIAFGSFGNVCFRNVAVKFACKSGGINHFPFGIARVDTYSLNGNLSACSVKVLIFKVADVASVHSIRPVATEFLDVKVVSATANLLIRVKGYTNITVFYFVVVAKITHSLHNLCNASLIVSAQKGCAICNNNIFALVSKKLWKLCWA